MSEVNKYRQKLTPEEREQLVDDVARGRPVARAAEKYGITTAAAWNLVNKEALRKALPQGVGPDRYLMQLAGTIKGRPKSPAQPTVANGNDQPGFEEIREAALTAAAALKRFADLAGENGQRSS